MTSDHDAHPSARVDTSARNAARICDARGGGRTSFPADGAAGSPSPEWAPTTAGIAGGMPGRLAAALALAHAGIPVISGYPPADVPGVGMIGCGCGHGACRSPGKHVVQDRSTADGPTTDLARIGHWWGGGGVVVGWWWGGGQDWSVVAVSGAGHRIDVVQLSHPGPPEAIVAWLEGRGFPELPTIVGHGHLEFLTKPSHTPTYAPLPTGWVRMPPSGEIVLLPPSRLLGGAPLAWLTGLPAHPELVAGAELFATLHHLPAPPELLAATAGPIGTDQPTSTEGPRGLAARFERQHLCPAREAPVTPK